MGNTYAWAPITKVEDQPDGTVMVYGSATDTSLDRDGQRMDEAWLDKAMPKWMAEGGNIREQHDPRRAVGVGVGLHKDEGSGAWMLTSHIVDPVAVLKVQTGVLKGYSIGVKEPHITFGKAEAPNGLIDGGSICETSLADRPSNPTSYFTLAKADDAGELVAVDEPEVVETAAGDEDVDEPEGEPGKVDEPDTAKTVTAAQRKKMAKAGTAMPNGDFPIPDAGHLQSAIGRLGNYSGDKTAAKAHIIKRARALGLVGKLPDDWHVSKADAVLAEVTSLVPDLAKADTAAAVDIAGAMDAIAAIARLIQSEAGSLAAGRLSEVYDIGCLLEAVGALKFFISCEQGEDPDDLDGPTSGIDQESSDYDVAGAVYAAKTDTPDEPARVKKQKKPKVDKADGAAPDVAAIVKAAVAQATEALEDRLKLVDAQLAKALAAPQPGGPVMMRTPDQTQQSRGRDVAALTAQATELREKADAIGTEDLVLAQGYRQLADSLMGRVAKL